MSRFVHQLVGSLLVLGSVSALASGCVEAEGRLFIEGFPVPDDDGACPVGGDIFTSRGGIVCDDETCDGSLCVQVRNQMSSSLDNDSNNNNVETSVVVLHSYDLRYIANGVDLSEADTTVNMTMSVEPEASSTVGISLIGGEGASQLAGSLGTELTDLVVGLRFYGRTTGGLEVETPETFIGVTVLKI